MDILSLRSLSLSVAPMLFRYCTEIGIPPCGEFEYWSLFKMSLIVGSTRLSCSLTTSFAAFKNATSSSVMFVLINGTGCDVDPVAAGFCEFNSWNSCFSLWSEFAALCVLLLALRPRSFANSLLPFPLSLYARSSPSSLSYMPPGE